MLVLHLSSEDSTKLVKVQRHLDDPQKVAFILIYSPNCGHCQQMKPEWKKFENNLLRDKYAFLRNKNIGVFDIENSVVSNLRHDALKKNINGYPTMRFVMGKNICENYEDCKYLEKDRSFEDFVKWIEQKVKEKKIQMRENEYMDEVEDYEDDTDYNTDNDIDIDVDNDDEDDDYDDNRYYSKVVIGGSRKTLKKNKKDDKKNKNTKTNKKSVKKRKWSLRYKRSINCNRPKGFSQRQYCLKRKNKK